jgi:rod shape-determining protein MreD
VSKRCAVALGALLVTVAMLQICLPAGDGRLSLSPDLVPALVFCAAVVGGSRIGTITGLASGAVLDLAPPADHPLGQWALVLAVCGALTGAALRVEHHPLWNLAGAAVIGAVAQLLFTGVGLALGDLHARADETVQAIPNATAWTVCTALVLFPLTRRMIRPAVEAVR